MADLYIEPDMEGIHGFNRCNQEEDFLQQFRAWSPAGGRREVTSRLTSPWDPPVIEPKEEKKGNGACWFFAGCCWACSHYSVRGGEKGLAQLGVGRLGLGGLLRPVLFFFEQNLFSLFQKQNKDNFCLKTPNKFKPLSKKICTNKVHTTRHKALVILEIKIMSLFKIEQGFNKTYVAYLKCHFSNNEIK